MLGVNVTLIWHLAFPARGLPHVFVWPKSPDAVMLVILSGALPELVIVTDFAPLVVNVA